MFLIYIYYFPIDNDQLPSCWIEALVIFPVNKEAFFKEQILLRLWQLTWVILWSNAILFLFETYICTQVPKKETFYSVWKNIIFFTTRIKKEYVQIRGHRNSFLLGLWCTFLPTSFCTTHFQWQIYTYFWGNIFSRPYFKNTKYENVYWNFFLFS